MERVGDKIWLASFGFIIIAKGDNKVRLMNTADDDWRYRWKLIDP